jgi:glutamate racemase
MLLIFDSGIGGLGVVEEIRRARPDMPMTYLADNGFYPYGEKPDAALISRIIDIVGRGIDIVKPDAVVIACNTASTVALGRLRAEFDMKFIGCVPPIKPAAAASRTGHIGLLATPATIRRPYLQDLIEKFAGGCEVHSLGTPILADLAELKFRGLPVDLNLLEAAVAPLFAGGAPIDAVALGCTHYTFLLPELTALRPEQKWFDPAGAVARQAIIVAGDAGAGASFEGAAFFTGVLQDEDIIRAGLRDFGFTDLGLVTPPGRTGPDSNYFDPLPY